MKRTVHILVLASLVVGMLAVCTACSAKRDETDEEPSIFERGTWALSSFKGRQAPYHYGFCNYRYEYNERGQIVESRESTNAVNIVSGQTLYCTWSDDGLSYECSYTLTMGNFGENSDSGTHEATFQPEYDGLSATYTARGEQIPRIWESGDRTVRYALEYRDDGTIRRKEVEGRDFADTLEVYDYDERGNLVHYERTKSGEDAPSEIRTYDIAYEGDVPKSVTVTKTFPSDDEDATDTEEDAAATTHTYELMLNTDTEGNVVSAECDGRKMASMSWAYLESPDPLSRLRIQANAASALELL
ncbi:MAG: hypothetical protein IKF14_03605 [Atopobiaceae bacterium]|nr:hypothetical protein [Atopobiaceae bacterium]